MPTAQNNQPPKVANLGLAYSGALQKEDGRKGTEGRRKETWRLWGLAGEVCIFKKEGDDQCHSHTQRASLGLAP